MVLISWGVNSFVIDKKDVIGENKVVLWNVADKQKEATDYIVKQIEKENPNLCCLVESKQNGKILKNKLPLHNFKQLRGNMSIFYKGKIDSILYQNKHKSFKYNLIYISNNENLKKILLVDLYASPFVHKKSSLKKIYSLIEIENPDVILGDFNTPYNGSLFLDFKQNFNDFHDLGLGFNSTWPYCIPIFELDMIWLDKKFKPISIERKNNILSDHKLITVTFD